MSDNVTTMGAITKIELVRKEHHWVVVLHGVNQIVHEFASFKRAIKFAYAVSPDEGFHRPRPAPTKLPGAH